MLVQEHPQAINKSHSRAQGQDEPVPSASPPAKTRQKMAGVPPPPLFSRLAGYLASSMAFSIIFLALDWLALVFVTENGVSAWYSPPGWSLAFLLVFGLNYTPVILIANLLSGYWIWKMPLELPLLATALASSAGYSLTALTLRGSLAPQGRLKNLPQALQFAGTGLIASLLVAIFGSASYLAGKPCAWQCYVQTVFQWWLGDAIGVLTLAPFLLEVGFVGMRRLKQRLNRNLRRSSPPSPIPPESRHSFWHPAAEYTAQAVVLLSAFALAFYAEAHTSDQLLYLCFLPVIWLALYYGLAGAAAGIFAVNVGIIGVYWLTGEGGESVLILQVFMLVLAITGLLLGVVVSERRANEHSLRRREAILSAITYAAERFLLESDWRGQMPQVLERLGQAAFASRVYVFENHFGSQGELLTSQRYEWVAPGVTPQIDNPALQNFAYLEGGFERWVEVLGRGEALYGLVRHFPPGEYEVLTAQDILSIAVVPVRVGETWWGFIGFDDCRVERTWEQTEIEALAVAADTLGAAIQRQQTEQELRRRERFLTLLNQITRDALEHHDFHDMVQTLADRLGEIFDADGCYLTHWDEEQQLTFPLAAYGPMRHTYALDQPQPGEVTMTESVLRAGHPLVAENVHQSPYLDPRIAARYPTVSMLALPLIAGEQWLGAALISYHQPHHFTPEEIARGEQVAAQISLAIAKARLFEAERQRTAQLSRANALITALGQVVTRVEGANDLQEVMETLGHELRQLGIHCLLTLLSPDQAYLNLGYLSLEKDQLAQAEQRTGLKFNEIRIPIVAIPLVGQILADGHPRVQHNPEGTALAAFSPYLPRALIRLGMKRLNLNARSTAIYLPLSVEEHIIGLLVVWGAHLQEADLSYLNIFASQVALALEKARLYADLQRLAVTDSLTGCYNRRGLFELGEREVERARRYERPLSLIMMDIDHFKRINDRFGHAAGDLALQALVQRIRGHVREIDLVGRYGGEEFVVLLPESDLPRAAQIAERLRQAIGESSIPTPQGAIDITVSIGVAQADAATKNLEALIGRADRALYAAKQRGRNCVSVEDRHGADLDNG